jgi:hypothetical protein
MRSSTDNHRFCAVFALCRFHDFTKPFKANSGYFFLDEFCSKSLSLEMHFFSQVKSGERFLETRIVLHFIVTFI